MQKIRLIAIDLDGTLLDEEKKISALNLNALREAADRGTLIAVASGRRFQDAIAYSRQIVDRQPVICANGAMACLNDPYQCVYCECMPKQKLRSVVEVLEREKCYYHVYCDDGAVMESRTGNPGKGRRLNCYDYQGEVLTGDEMPKYVGDGALKVVCFIPDAPKLARVRAAMEALGGLEINSSWWDNLEILEQNVNKGAALRALAQSLDIPMSEVMAIGDNENDLSMFEAAGLSVAMGNASDRVKEKADYVTQSNGEDGVGRAVRKLVLGEGN